MPTPFVAKVGGEQAFPQSRGFYALSKASQSRGSSGFSSARLCMGARCTRGRCPFGLMAAVLSAAIYTVAGASRLPGKVTGAQAQAYELIDTYVFPLLRPMASLPTRPPRARAHLPQHQPQMIVDPGPRTVRSIARTVALTQLPNSHVIALQKREVSGSFCKRST